MLKFIVLTFGFLAFGLYELSGGSDFDPEKSAEALVLARVETEKLDKSDRAMARAETGVNSQPASANDDIVARAALNLVSFESVTTESPQPAVAIEASKDVQDTPRAAVATLEEYEQAQPKVKLIGVASIDGDYTNVSFSGLSTTASSDQVAMQQDLRAVTGTVVNMRSGPGTNYGVIGQLKQDQTVEVLTDTGTGWVELRSIDGGQTGWMADFLLAKR